MRLSTAFFVEGDPADSGGSGPTPDRIDLEWLAVGKKAGLTLAEIGELRIRDLVAYVEIYRGTSRTRARVATQRDIDAFFVN